MKTPLFLFIVSIVVCYLSLASCKKEDPEVVVTHDTIIEEIVHVSDTPQIEFVSISPTSVIQYEDAITIVFSYVDGNGDLGENNTENQNLFIVDSRNNLTYEYRIPQLTPNLDDHIAITGEFSVEISSTALLDENVNAETFHYSLYVVDRAGLKSNTIISEGITVSK